MSPSLLPSHRNPRNFDNEKIQCLGKRDKSFAGRIDPKAVDICAEINARKDFYTTSSCSGRCFLYRGMGIKATNDFERFRISHDLIYEPQRYFDLTTLESDPTGGADPIRTIGQFEHAELLLQRQQQEQEMAEPSGGTVDEPEVESGNFHLQTYVSAELTNENINDNSISLSANHDVKSDDTLDVEPQDDNDPNHRPDTSRGIVWLRFEPFILHVACRTLTAAAELAGTARCGGFKNVGLTSWKDSKYILAIWGDEGLDMPLGTTEEGTLSHVSQLGLGDNDGGKAKWLAEQVNERHGRNWNKIQRFVQGVRSMPESFDDNDEDEETPNSTAETAIPRSYDVIGDIALLHVQPSESDREEIGNAIMKKNKAIKLVAVRTSTLDGVERAAGSDGMLIIAGQQRSPLVTTHTEYGIKCVVDLNHTFFSPRMGVERLRICQQVARGERVLVLFAGVGMEALQIAGRTEALSITAVEINPIAVDCARRAHRMLSRNPAVKCMGAADRLEIIQGDVLEILPTIERNSIDRILAPRPKEGAFDGDLGQGEGGVTFLEALLPVLKHDGGECHWYEFAADHEFPACERSRRMIEHACQRLGLSLEILHVAKVGSVAMRQLRVCIDFKVSPLRT